MQIHKETIPILGRHKVKMTAYISHGENDPAGLRRPAILILPGGAFLFCAPSEGEPVALRFLKEGYQTFVLEYSTYSSIRNNELFMPQLCEIAECLSIINAKANEWGVDPLRICLMGFSAGANLAACYSTYWNDSFMDEQYGPYRDCQPLPVKAAVLCYPVLDRPENERWAEDISSSAPHSEKDYDARRKMKRRSSRALFGTETPDEETLRNASPIYRINPDVPPTFIWHTAEDRIAYPVSPMKYAMGLYELGIPCELHIFDKGQHALALADDITEAAFPWSELALRWLERNLK